MACAKTKKRKQSTTPTAVKLQLVSKFSKISNPAFKLKSNSVVLRGVI